MITYILSGVIVVHTSSTQTRCCNPQQNAVASELIGFRCVTLFGSAIVAAFENSEGNHCDSFEMLKYSIEGRMVSFEDKG